MQRGIRNIGEAMDKLYCNYGSGYIYLYIGQNSLNCTAYIDEINSI